MALITRTKVHAERLLNLNWCLCGRCKVRKTARECVCCVEEPESENKLEGTLSTSIRMRRVLVLFSISFFFFVIFAEDEILYNSCNYVWFFLSFASFTTEKIMSVVHFKTVMSEVIGTNIEVFFFWQELFVLAFALPSFFLFTAKRWKEIPFLPSL